LQKERCQPWKAKNPTIVRKSALRNLQMDGKRRGKPVQWFDPNDRGIAPQERLAITEQELKRLTEQREAQMEQTERLFRGLKYLFWALWVMTMLWILADHFWK
jgi:hypothetical protein